MDQLRRSWSVAVVLAVHQVSAPICTLEATIAELDAAEENPY